MLYCQEEFFRKADAKKMIVLTYADKRINSNKWEDVTNDYSKKKNKSFILYDTKNKRFYGSIFPNKKSMKRALKCIMNNKVLSGYKVRLLKSSDIIE